LKVTDKRKVIDKIEILRRQLHPIFSGNVWTFKINQVDEREFHTFRRRGSEFIKSIQVASFSLDEQVNPKRPQKEIMAHLY